MSKAVPNEWSSGELSKYCDIVGGGTPDRNVPDYWGGDIPWVSPTEITSRTSKYITDTKEHITQLGLAKSSAKLHPPGTVLMTSRASIGYVAINTVPMATNQGFQSLRCKNGVSPDYMYQHITWMRPKLEKMSSGSTFSELSSSNAKKLRVILPPFPEQEKIAAILTSIDDVIEKTRARIDKLKDLKTGMMQELLTKGIGHTEFKDSPVGKIPTRWKYCELSMVVNAIVDCEHKTAPYVERSEYLVVRTSNVRGGELILDDMKYTNSEAYQAWTQRAVPQAGDILFTREAPAGESCLVPKSLKICMGQRMVLLRPDRNKVLPDFLSLFLSTDLAKLAIYDLSIGTTVTRINIEDIRKIPCLVPPLDEQEKISQHINSTSNALTKKRRRLDQLELIKKALMQDLLTGKVRVNVETKEPAVA